MQTLPLAHDDFLLGRNLRHFLLRWLIILVAHDMATAECMDLAAKLFPKLLAPARAMHVLAVLTVRTEPHLHQYRRRGADDDSSLFSGG